ncbi:alpha/beta hydrolase [Paenibacillus macerans]|uniref:alpha/beta fold hydrolase n=1 Tax=Paenibacillus macerans TaxID=44252 RepID=UPI002889DBF8|nr:alpha/beta hydrolase [Paenibacillus macerans]
MISLKKTITLPDNSVIEVGLAGQSNAKTLMLPVVKKPVYGQEAESLKQWGVDPESGKHLVEGLADRFQVLFFDYEGHLFQNPVPDDLTPEHIVNDFLHIADQMNIRQYSYYGYSWLALAGLQLAIRSDRLESLIMGGYPPYEGPYREMLVVTEKTYQQALHQKQNALPQQAAPENPADFDWDNVTVTIDPFVTKQFMTLYQSLMDFDDRSILDKLAIPKLTFAGEQDTIAYGENFGNVTVDIVGRLKKNQGLLSENGWDIEILPGSGMDHTRAMQPNVVLPVIKPWLVEKLLGEKR